MRNVPIKISDKTMRPSPERKSRAEALEPGSPSELKSGADYPDVRTSKLDLEARPIYDPAGKPIDELNLDEGNYNGTSLKTSLMSPIQISRSTISHGVCQALT